MKGNGMKPIIFRLAPILAVVIGTAHMTDAQTLQPRPRDTTKPAPWNRPRAEADTEKAEGKTQVTDAELTAIPNDTAEGNGSEPAHTPATNAVVIEIHPTNVVEVTSPEKREQLFASDTNNVLKTYRLFDAKTGAHRGVAIDTKAKRAYIFDVEGDYQGTALTRTNQFYVFDDEGSWKLIGRKKSGERTEVFDTEGNLRAVTRTTNGRVVVIPGFSPLPPPEPERERQPREEKPEDKDSVY
jgi:hypothetical protein